jgi:hypothetical protein
MITDTLVTSFLLQSPSFWMHLVSWSHHNPMCLRQHVTCHYVSVGRHVENRSLSTGFTAPFKQRCRAWSSFSLWYDSADIMEWTAVVTALVLLFNLYLKTNDSIFLFSAVLPFHRSPVLIFLFLCDRLFSPHSSLLVPSEMFRPSMFFVSLFHFTVSWYAGVKQPRNF